MTRVMVFGTFDGLHEGHRSFLRQAREHGDQLVIAVAPDEIVARLKKRAPQYTLSERIGELQRAALADLVVEGDLELGSYGVVRQYKPDVIALGYDQDALKTNIMDHIDQFNRHIEIVTLQPHEPERHHTSIIRGNR